MTSVEMMWIGCGMIRGSLLGGKGWDLFEVSTILSFLGFVSSHCVHVQAYAETQ